MTEMIWHQQVSGDVLQEGLDLLLTSLQEDKTNYLLIDTRSLAFFGPTDQRWIRKVFLPKLSGKHVKRFARIIGPDTLNQAIISNILCSVQERRSTYTFVVESFYERDEALEWLLEPICV
ncbi:SpoIIAA family protein [Pontibacter oryzae]|uniref:STAS/SEC14 domain-containing protein n=1 Tax=Pontibacter oryzae TaxID=2304593 RepID=A0A399SFU0_9BACT|nr:STAS/SEC14 domain-containing protein [Pontibacter oryzae]RIJ41403.1 STAS/SEC14 domain-containing protein [Pontibacter oryzae]